MTEETKTMLIAIGIMIALVSFFMGVFWLVGII